MAPTTESFQIYVEKCDDFQDSFFSDFSFDQLDLMIIFALLVLLVC